MDTKQEQFKIDPTGAEWLEHLRYGGIEGDETHVDLDTGHVLCIGNFTGHTGKDEDMIDDDDAKEALQAMIDADPDRFLQVPDLCFDPLPDFIESDWTDDADLLAETREIYWQNQRRYAGFKNNAPDAAVFAFQEYQTQCREESLEAFYVELAEKAAARRAKKEQVRQRLEAEAKTEAAKDRAAGEQAGRKWAEAVATPKQLRRLEAAVSDPYNRWHPGVSIDSFTWAEHLYGIIEPDAEDVRVDELLGDDMDEQNNPDFVLGFADGACEVWAESGLE